MSGDPSATARRLAPGLLLSALLGAAGYALHLALPGLSAVLLALVLGLIVGNARPRGRFQPGAAWTVKRGLDLAVILLGFGISVETARQVGLPGFALVAIMVPATLLLFLLIGRTTNQPGRTALLLGAGTAICGASAIAATATVVRAKERETALALGAVGVLSSIGLLAFPFIGAALDLDPTVYGAWAGASIHAVANAIGAGLALSPEAGAVATVVKLTRVATLPLLVLAISLHEHRGKTGWPTLPPMVWGFVLAAVATNVLPLPDTIREAVAITAEVLFLGAMGALGYMTDLRAKGERTQEAVIIAIGGWIAMSLLALGLAVRLYS